MLHHKIAALCLVYGFLTLTSHKANAQAKGNYWQQEISYKIAVDLNTRTNQFTGLQSIQYRNNSQETLDRVFFHLYFNAFQPGSAMDIRSRTIPDPDPRVGARIKSLKPDEIGFHDIRKLTQNGKNLAFEVNGTILEVRLAEPIKPGQKTTFEMEYLAQVPLQIRRSGRDNAEGIRYSMSQWYPKLCEYDRLGWHAHPYVGREFYGVWGDFDVSITLDSEYTVAATGVLQKPNKIGHGYAPSPKKEEARTTWRFKASNVHDFVWAADPDYIHEVHICRNGVVLRAFYQPHETYSKNWELLLPIMEEVLSYLNTHFGTYPYPEYAFIQGGDGGMEYPMATLITGHRPLNSLVGVSIHEIIHSWYQGVLGFNESYYYWMDEGFTDYAETRTINYLKEKGLHSGSPSTFPFDGTYKRYSGLVERGYEEPLSTHADHFDFNTAYSISAYVKGAVFLHQLEYVIGKPAFDKGMLSFFQQWKFKHPDVNDFIRVMEKISNLELDWYKDYMVYSVKTIDYAVDTVFADGDQTVIGLYREGRMPMPIDLAVEFDDGTVRNFTIPLDIMRGYKQEAPQKGMSFELLPDWDWVNPYYVFRIASSIGRIQSVTIDPTLRLADQVPDNNTWTERKEIDRE